MEIYSNIYIYILNCIYTKKDVHKHGAAHLLGVCWDWTKSHQVVKTIICIHTNITKTDVIWSALMTKHWNDRGIEKSESTPANTKCPVNIVHICSLRLEFHTVSQSSSLTEHQCSFASSLGAWGEIQPHEAGSRGNVNV